MMRKYIQGLKRPPLYGLLVGTTLFVLVACERSEYQLPQQKDVIEVVFASGHISTEGQYNIVSAVDGYIQESSIKEGMLIPDGYVLAEIDQDAPSAQLDDAKASYTTAKEDSNPNSPKIQELEKKIVVAKKELVQNERLLESYSRLVKTNAVSRIDYENQLLLTERSKKDLAVLQDSKIDLLRSLDLNLTNANNLVKIRKDEINKYQLRAKGESLILKTYHKEGEYIRRGETLAEMGRGNPIVKLFIEESDINSIRKGQEVELSVNTYAGKLFSGTIIHIYPAFDEVQQSFIADAQFIDQPEQLFSGTQVQANIITSKKENTLVIPTKSLVSEDQVITKDKGLTKLTLGIKNPEWVEVLEGITISDYIQVDPNKG